MTAPEPVIARCTRMTEQLRREINAAFPELAFDGEESARFLSSPDNLLLLATRGGHVCGVLVGHRLQRLDQRRAEVLLYSIDVREEFRRQGIGSRLIEATRTWAAEVGADEVWVLTERSNNPAMALYRSAGGVEDPPDTVMLTFPVA